MLVTDEILAYYLKSILGNPTRIIELDGKEKNLQKDDVVVYNGNFYKMIKTAKMTYPEAEKCDKMHLNNAKKIDVIEIKKKILGTI